MDADRVVAALLHLGADSIGLISDYAAPVAGYIPYICPHRKL